MTSAFVFVKRIVQFLFFLNSKFPASSHFLCKNSSVSVEPFQKPHCWFSHDVAYTPQPLYNTIAGIQANCRVSYPTRVIMRVKCIDI